MEAKTERVPEMQDVIDALGLDHTCANDWMTNVGGIELRLNKTGGSAWQPTYNRVTLNMKVGYRGERRSERRSVIIHKGHVDPRTMTVERRPLTDAEKAKVAEKYAYLRERADRAEAAQKADRGRRREREAYQWSVAREMPHRYNLQGSTPQRNCQYRSPVDHDLRSGKVSLQVPGNMAPAEVAKLVRAIEAVATEYGITR